MGNGEAESRAAWPVVSPVNLYSYLVTRQTGRAVRLGIQGRLAELNGRVLAVVDFREVQLIDFSCADEVVAKLVRQAGRSARPRAFFLLRGLAEHHVDPVQSALRRQELAVAAERDDGRPLLLGSVSRSPARAWREVCRLGRAGAERIAECMHEPASAVHPWLERLHRRRLLLRNGPEYVSLRQALSEVRGTGGVEPGGCN